MRKDGEEYIVKGAKEKDEDERHHRHKRSVGRKFHTNKHTRRRNKHLILHPNTKKGAFPLPDIIGEIFIEEHHQIVAQLQRGKLWLFSKLHNLKQSLVTHPTKIQWKQESPPA